MTKSNPMRVDDETEIFINHTRAFHLSYTENLGGVSAVGEIRPLTISPDTKAFYNRILDVEVK